jgi:two-component system sensor histidine kinase/response regulator
MKMVDKNERKSKHKTRSNESDRPLILVVDDVSRNLKVLAQILREEGYKISIANSGSRALDMVNARLPDLILLDVMMPEMDGFEVCRQLKAAEPSKDIPVIFLTALAEVENLVKGFECGAVDYVAKPFNRAELLVRVNTHLQLKQAQKEIIRLEQKNAVLAMTVTAGHELNQPLTVLSGNFQLLQSRLSQMPLGDKEQKYLAKMGNAIQKVQELLKKFSDAKSVRLEDYVGDQKMVVFEES